MPHCEQLGCHDKITVFFFSFSIEKNEKITVEEELKFKEHLTNQDFIYLLVLGTVLGLHFG